MDTSYLKIKYDESMYYQYEKEIMKMGQCNSLLKAKFINVSDEKFVIFNTENHILLSKYMLGLKKEIDTFGSKIEIKVLYKIMREILYSIEDIFYNLLSEDNLNMNLDYIFIQPKEKKIKFAYVPNDRNTDMMEKFIKFSYDICEISRDENWRYAVKSFYDYILLNHPSIKNMIYYLNDKING